MGKAYRSEVDQWLKDDNLMLLQCWARDGDTLQEIAGKIGISRQSLNNWCKQYEEINEALSVGKEIIDYKVENAILKAALGYKVKEIKVTVGKQNFNGTEVELLKETTIKEIPPNIQAATLWLNNRKFEQWKRNRDKVEEYREEDNNINITIVRGPGDNLGDNVNQEVHYEGTVNKGRKVDDESLNEGDKDYWPEDWEDEE